MVRIEIAEFTAVLSNHSCLAWDMLSAHLPAPSPPQCTFTAAEQLPSQGAPTTCLSDDTGASASGSDLQPWGNIFHRAYCYVWLTQGFPGFFHVWWGHSIHSTFCLTALMSPFVVAYCFILFVTLLPVLDCPKGTRAKTLAQGGVKCSSLWTC